jgi:hypothetical protein
MRVTICVDVNEPAEVALTAAWFERWREHLVYVSPNAGSGCCVDMWDVDAPDAAVSELPAEVRASSAWASAV